MNPSHPIRGKLCLWGLSPVPQNGVVTLGMLDTTGMDQSSGKDTKWSLEAHSSDKAVCVHLSAKKTI